MVAMLSESFVDTTYPVKFWAIQLPSYPAFQADRP